jgi:hypothetical protein
MRQTPIEAFITIVTVLVVLAAPALIIAAYRWAL